MSQVTSYVSSKEIINRLYGSTGLQEGLNYTDLVEWIYQVMELIHYPMQYIRKILGWKEDDRLNYSEYIFPLPDDFHSLIAMSVDGIKARPSSSDFATLLDGNCCGVDNLPSYLSEFSDNFGNTFSPAVGNTSAVSYPHEVGFVINNGVVTLDKKVGKVCMAYNSFPIDCDGFPLIPNVEQYKRAVELFIRRNIDYQNWRNDSDSRGKKALYDDSEQEYCFAVAAADTHLKMPDVHEMENIKNSLLRLRPRIQEYNNFFRTLSSNTGIA